MSDHNTHSGIAALSICKALMLALNDAKILPDREIPSVMEHAAEVHRNVAGH